jgi:phenylalanyl-tRNA synthetase beta chain
MKISLQFLQDYISLGSVSHQQLVDEITEKVAEVDELEVQGEFLDRCVIGKILTVMAHPNADRLRVCTVQTENGVKQVVCGGSNLYEGMFVAFAHVGATVKWHGADVVTLEPVKLRGESSEGMICAGEELGIDDLYPSVDEKGIVDLGELSDDVIGTPLREFLGRNDAIIHIDNHAITHRPDLFSHIGFARELVAMGLATWRDGIDAILEAKNSVALPTSASIIESPTLIVEDETCISRYFSCVLHIDGMGQTPDWMKKRLASGGIRSITLPVDITNFVMLEMGVPMHSFDLDDVQGNIVMRLAKAGEKITTLDSSERELSEGAIVFSDDTGIFDLVGIMGGLRTSTREETKRIYLHAGSFDPVRIRKAMMAMGHRTEAGTIYEKGVPAYNAEQGFYRALQLFTMLVPGAKVVSQIDERGAMPSTREVTVCYSWLIRQLGFTIEFSHVQTLLRALGFTVSELVNDSYTVTMPLWRRDITGPHDIVEEVARMYGYNAIEPKMPSANIMPPKRDYRIQNIRRALQQLGYLELLPLSLVGPKLIDACGFNSSEAITIADPIGEELSMMQPSVLCTLLEHAVRVDTTKNHNGVTFTIARVFRAGGIEYTQFGMLVRVPNVATVVAEPYVQLAQHIFALRNLASVPLALEELSEDALYMHPGRKSAIVSNGTAVGKVFEVHPNVIANLQLEGRFACALFHVDSLLALPVHTKLAQSVPAYPPITYDYTFTWNVAKPLAPLLNAAKASCELLESIVLIDMFSKTVPAVQANVTVRCTYRSTSGTLTEAQVQPMHAAVIALLHE